MAGFWYESDDVCGEYYFVDLMAAEAFILKRDGHHWWVYVKLVNSKPIKFWRFNNKRGAIEWVRRVIVQITGGGEIHK